MASPASPQSGPDHRARPDRPQGDDPAKPPRTGAGAPLQPRSPSAGAPGTIGPDGTVMAAAARPAGKAPPPRARIPEPPPALRPAGFWLRFFAWLVDLTILGIAFAAVDFAIRRITGLALLSYVVSLVDRGWTGAGGAMLALLAVVVAWLLVPVAVYLLCQVLGLVYYTLFEASAARATPGKTLFALRVVDAHGDQVSWGRALARQVLKFAALLPAAFTAGYLLLALGRSGLEAPSVAASTFFGLTVILAPLLFAIFYGMAGWTKDGQALHDMLSGCFVTRAQEMPAGRKLALAATAVGAFLLVQVAVPAIWNVRDAGARIAARAPEASPAAPTILTPSLGREAPPPAAPAGPENEPAAAESAPATATSAPAPVAADRTPTADAASTAPAAAGAAPAGSQGELHVIGIGHGAYAPGADTRPWWAKCKDDPGMSEKDCHARYAGKREPSFAKLSVSYDRAPVILALLGSDPVTWDVHVAPGVDLERVILAGSYRQEVKGIPPGVPIEVYGGSDAFACESCTRAGSGFYAYDVGSGDYGRAMQRLGAITGRKPASVQLAREGGDYFLGPLVKRYDTLPAEYRRWEPR